MRLLLLLSITLLLFSSCRKKKKIAEASVEMQNFIFELSDYAKSLKSDFYIIPQNGLELLYVEADRSNPLNEEMLDKVDGWGVEELYYLDGEKVDAPEDETPLKELHGKTILVSEYIKFSGNEQDAIDQNTNNGWLCYPRWNNNYDYEHVQSIPVNENDKDLKGLKDGENFLYLISDSQFEKKEDYLNALMETNFDILLIDLFFQGEALSYDDVQQLKIKANGALRKVLAYQNIGAAETYRYYWQSNWELGNPSWIKKEYEGYSDEFYVEFWNPEWKKRMYGNYDAYLDKIINAGFDGVYLDNIEAYYFLYKKK